MSRIVFTLAFLLLFLPAKFCFADEPTYIVPEEVFKDFSKEKRIEYVRDIIKILAQHEKTWNYGKKISLTIFFEEVFAQAPDAKKSCIIGTKKLPLDPVNKICTTIIASDCGPAVLYFQCGELALKKCVDRKPIDTLSQRCFQAALADDKGLESITQPQLEAAVQMFKSTCNAVGDKNGCFFLDAQLKKKGIVVGSKICDSLSDEAIIASGNIMNGNGGSVTRPNPRARIRNRIRSRFGIEPRTITVPDTTEIRYPGVKGTVQKFTVGDLKCASCHSSDLSDLTYREWDHGSDKNIAQHLNDVSMMGKEAVDKLKKDLGANSEDKINGIACVMGRFIDIGRRYPSVITSDRTQWKIPYKDEPPVSHGHGEY
jgi:hypothetical protein